MLTTNIAKIALGLLFSLFANAQQMQEPQKPLESETAGFLAQACKAPPTDNSSHGFCVGTIGGFRDVIDSLPVLTPDGTKRIRIEQTATDGQLQRVFVAYMTAHPEVENQTVVYSFCLGIKRCRPYEGNTLSRNRESQSFLRRKQPRDSTSSSRIPT